MLGYDNYSAHRVCCRLLGLVLLALIVRSAGAQSTNLIIPEDPGDTTTSDGVGSAIRIDGSESSGALGGVTRGPRGGHGLKDAKPADSSAGTDGFGHVEGSSSAAIQVEPDASGEFGKPFGTVLHVAGDVAAIAPDSNEMHHLKAGDRVRVGDHLQSSDGGELLLQETDGGMLALRPASELWIESYAAAGQASDHIVLRLVSGGARAISGWIARLNPAGSQLITPTTTIGVGSSDHEAYALSAELASAYRAQPGSYDMVYRGATTLRAANQDLVIDVNQVGFVGAAPPSTSHSRTVLLPTSLAKVPAFFGRGSFDQEMDSYVKDIDRTSEDLLQRQLGNITLAPAVCDPVRVGKSWLRSLDAALARRDNAKVQALFNQDASFTASIHDAAGTATVHDVDRTGFTHSLVGPASASSSSQQRASSTFLASADTHHGGCAEVVVQSMVTQRGVLQGKPYQAQSAESYQLELFDGTWLAVRATSAQQ